MYNLDYPQNFAITKIDPIASGAVSVTLEDPSKFADPATYGEYNCVIFNQNTGPADDPFAEIVRATAKSGSVLTITRAQEGTSDVNHNTSGKIYVIAATLTSKMITDIDNYISIAGIGTPSYNDLKDFIATTQSSGRISGGALTAHAPANGTLDIAEITGMIHIADSVGSELKFFKMAAQASLSLTDNALNYIYIDYNSGTPVAKATTDRSTIHNYDHFTIGRAYRQGTSVDITSSGTNIYNGYRRIHNRLITKYGFDWASGSVVTESDTRKLAVSNGVWYMGNSEIDTTGFDTNVSGSFSTYYTSDSGSTWTKTTSVTQLGNTQYNDVASGLATMTANKYANYWVYMCPEGSLYIVYGQAQYNSLAEAQGASGPTYLPDYLTKNAKLISRITFLKSATNFSSVTSLRNSNVSTAIVSLHNNLGNLGWSSSGHTGSASNIAGFDGAGAASYYTLSGSGTVLATIVGPTFTSANITASDATGNLFVMTNTDATNYTRIKYVGTGVTFSAGVGNASAVITDLRDKWYVYDFTNSKIAMTIIPNTLAAKFYGTIESVGGATIGGTIELGHASDTTLARISAGKISVEGVEILTVAGGTMTGNITLGENTSIDHDPSLSADGKYTGLAITGTAGATLAFGDLIYLDPTDSRWELADANIAAGSDGDPRGILGMCVLAAANDGDATKILLQGVIRADTAFPTFTINAPIYVSETAGDVVVTQPTTADVVIRIVGFGLTADSMYFNPENSYITHT